MSKERVRFVLEWERRWNEGEGVVNMSELCREFGISRECGHKHVRRYVEGGWDLEAVEERSRRPHRSPSRVEEEMEGLVVQARKLKPKWGPVKLRRLAQGVLSGRCIPKSEHDGGDSEAAWDGDTAEATNGQGVGGRSSPFPECEEPNAVWCVDFKGWLLAGYGRRCYPLTISDAYSRYVLRCEGMRDPDGKGAFTVFDSAFASLDSPRQDYLLFRSAVESSCERVCAQERGAGMELDGAPG